MRSEKSLANGLETLLESALHLLQAVCTRHCICSLLCWGSMLSQQTSCPVLNACKIGSKNCLKHFMVWVGLLHAPCLCDEVCDSATLSVPRNVLEVSNICLWSTIHHNDVVPITLLKMSSGIVKHRDSSLLLRGTNAKVLVTLPLCPKGSDVFLPFKFNSCPRDLSHRSLTMPVLCEPVKRLLLGVIAQLKTERLATVNLTN